MILLTANTYVHYGNFNVIDTFMIDSLRLFYADGDTVKTSCNISFLGDAGFDGNFEVGGKLTVDSLISGKKVGLYAFLNEQDTTTVVASELSFLQGSFTNSPSYGFGNDGDTLLYIGSDTVNMLIGYDITASHSMPSSYIELVIENDDSTYTNQSMRTYAKNLGQKYSFSGHLVICLVPNHKIKLMLTSDKSGDIIVEKLTTYAMRFYF